jgi:chaperone required for assembly of F1-ATPase
MNDKDKSGRQGETGKAGGAEETCAPGGEGARSGLGLSAEKIEQLMRDRFERPLPRRFYRDARADTDGPPYSVLLDQRPLRTPMKAPLALPTRRLAEAIAEEWAAQGERINPFSMPLTRIANAAIDRVRPRREEVIADLLETAAHDMLCYRAEHPAELAARQAQLWTPVLDWAAETLGARLRPVSGVMPIRQPEASLAALSNALAAHDDFELAAISTMAGLAHSLLLALAVARGHLPAHAAWEAANVEEDWNIAQWGADAEAMARRQARERDFTAAARLLTLLDRNAGGQW